MRVLGSRRPEFHRPWVGRLTPPVVALALVLLSFAGSTLPAAAGEDPSVTSTTTATVPANATTTLAGVSVSGFDPAAMVEVTVSTDVGTLSMTEALGNLVLDYGNHWSGDPSISFWTLPRDANISLASLALTTGDDDGPAHVSVTAWERDPDYVYSPTNRHFYSYVADGSLSWNDARDAAKSLSFMGQSGYLATMSTPELNDFVSNRIAGAADVFFGAAATNTYGQPVQRTWAWVDGPLAGQPISYCSNSAHACEHVGDSAFYSSWAPDEPNNFAVWDNGTGEWVGLTNVNGSNGLWNDVPGTWTGSSGYVVEFGDQARGSSGFGGAYTDASTVQITPASKADAPTDVTAQPGNQSATVSFVPGDDNGATVTTYRVTASPGGATADCSESPCTLTGLTNGTSYTFSVVAVAGRRTSDPSADSDAVTPGLPGAPTLTAVTSRPGALSLSFTPGDGAGAPPATGYEYSLDGHAWEPLTHSGSATVTGTITGLTNGQTYSVRVRALNTAGASAASNARTGTPAGRPGAPTRLKVRPGDRTLSVTFAPPTNDGGRRITRYELSDDNGRSWFRLDARPPLGAVDEGVLNGHTYTVLARAVNALGAGPASRVTLRTPAWFSDPVSPAAHKREVAVPKNPKKYHGPRRFTKANARSAKGVIAYPDTRLAGRQLQPGQAVDLGGVFRFDSGALSPAGRARVKAMAKSLRYVSTITCEGYADYGGTTARENKLARQRSVTVCTQIHRYAEQVTSRKTVSYGPKRPVVVGGKASDRGRNRRVVVVVR